METAKKVHESLQKRAKNNHYGVYWNDWIVLRLDDCDMTKPLEISLILNIRSFVL